MKRRKFLQNAGILGIAPVVSASLPANAGSMEKPAFNKRQLWLNYLQKLAEPILTALAANQLKEKMPVEAKETSLVSDRAKYTHLEAFGRLLAGIAPFLQLEQVNTTEKRLQDRYFNLAIKGIENATNPGAKDYMNWGDEGGQPLVDASFFAYGLIRCPKLWNSLDKKVQKNAITCLLKTREIKPPESNWLLFAAMIEAFFISINESFDVQKIDYAVKRHQEWYKGDGMYGDGPEFHWDYYNSFVIHPYLYDILKIVAAKDNIFEPIRKQVLAHNLRYVQIQERLIAADGSYPVIGRSITYRTGAFHHLANMALQHQLPEHLNPAQIRCALTTVIKKVTEAKGMFDNIGWLQIGLYGHQPSLAEGYISTGSLYLCSTILLPLGLPESDAFWSAPDEDWTAKKVLNGVDLPADHST
ncbi:DUF2264 domain-containing protein [Mucilaginibacter xinganensis]|uniref:DUF2264 domain-containing protein n=1 Tax=Mucilaginibacter xinganensis TaxID=1234841 RepID=A0A223NXE0_9SPHI|nr:DUF2264 domain-containing protein [Mucilaginibacter xinganensis]ASU34549.1 hypothetical protein MuYL_2662 [Mucilaginibacter xinganensis]